MVNWKTIESKDRLLAAVLAAHPDKKLLDYRKIATYFGEKTTYDSIEGQFRIIRKQAEELRAAVDSGEHEQAPPRGGVTPKGKAVSTPKTSGSAKGRQSGAVALTNSVIAGRVQKSKSPDKSRKSQPLNKSKNSQPIKLDDENFARQNRNQILGMREDILSSDCSIVTIEDDDDDDDPAPFANLVDEFGQVNWSLDQHF